MLSLCNELNDQQKQFFNCLKSNTHENSIFELSKTEMLSVANELNYIPQLNNLFPKDSMFNEVELLEFVPSVGQRTAHECITLDLTIAENKLKEFDNKTNDFARLSHVESWCENLNNSVARAKDFNKKSLRIYHPSLTRDSKHKSPENLIIDLERYKKAIEFDSKNKIRDNEYRINLIHSRPFIFAASTISGSLLAGAAIISNTCFGSKFNPINWGLFGAAGPMMLLGINNHQHNKHIKENTRFINQMDATKKELNNVIKNVQLFKKSTK